MDNDRFKYFAEYLFIENSILKRRAKSNKKFDVSAELIKLFENFYCHL